MKPAPLFVIDTETTGLDPRRDRMHQLAAVLVTSENEVKPVGQWRVPVPRRLKWTRRKAFYEAQAIHKVPTGVLENVGDPLSAMRALRGHWRAILAGHNVAFDVAMLRAWWGREWYLHEFPFGYHTVDLSTLGTIHLGKAKLHDIADALGVKREGMAHDAMSDALLTARCFQAFRAGEWLSADGVGLVGAMAKKLKTLADAEHSRTLKETTCPESDGCAPHPAPPEPVEVWPKRENPGPKPGYEA